MRAALRRGDDGDPEGPGQRRPQYRVPACAGIALEGDPRIWALAADTDGVDGSEDNAGALLYPDTLARAAAKRVTAKAMLADNDPWTFFKAIGDLLVTGPTLTNVNDFRAVLIAKG